jgi:hypothetical protein
MTDHLLDSAASLLDAGDACRIAHIRTARWISHPVASRAHNAMSLLLDRPVTLRPRGLLLTGPYHNGKTMIAERLRIPGRSGRGFRFDPVTDSNLIRSPIPGYPVTLFG